MGGLTSPPCHHSYYVRGLFGYFRMFYFCLQILMYSRKVHESLLQDSCACVGVGVCVYTFSHNDDNCVTVVFVFITNHFLFGLKMLQFVGNKCQYVVFVVPQVMYGNCFCFCFSLYAREILYWLTFVRIVFQVVVRFEYSY